MPREQAKVVSIEQLEEIKQKNDPNYNFTAWKDEQFQSEMELLKSKRNEILKECGENYEKFNK